MKKVGKIKFEARAKELVILIIFIAVTSFAIIEVKNLLNQEKVKNLTEGLNFTTSGNDDKNNGLLANLAENTPLRVTGNAVAVLDIPTYSIRGQIVEGTDDDTLKNYIGFN